jgi:hypothetical protein
MSASAHTQSRLFLLPRELRDDIYKHNVAQEDGYLYNPSTQKLLNVDLALSYTCHLLAREMRGLSLLMNPITFTTIHTPEGP